MESAWNMKVAWIDAGAFGEKPDYRPHSWRMAISAKLVSNVQLQNVCPANETIQCQLRFFFLNHFSSFIWYYLLLRCIAESTLLRALFVQVFHAKDNFYYTKNFTLYKLQSTRKVDDTESIRLIPYTPCVTTTSVRKKTPISMKTTKVYFFYIKKYQ